MRFAGMFLFFFFFNDTATTEIYTLSLHDALPICWPALDTPPRSPAHDSFSRPGAANAHPGRLAPSRALRTAERGLDVLRGRDERVRLGHGDLLPLLRVHLVDESVEVAARVRGLTRVDGGEDVVQLCVQA